MKRGILAAITAFMLSACQTMTGSGPINFAPDIKAAYDHYMNQSEEVYYFAVAEDGSSSSFYYYCDEFCYRATAQETIKRCEARIDGRVPCKAYAYNKEVIWDYDQSKLYQGPGVPKPSTSVGFFLPDGKKQARITWLGGTGQSLVGAFNVNGNKGEIPTSFTFLPDSDDSGICFGKFSNLTKTKVDWELKCGEEILTGRLEDLSRSSGTFIGSGTDSHNVPLQIEVTAL